MRQARPNRKGWGAGGGRRPAPHADAPPLGELAAKPSEGDFDSCFGTEGVAYGDPPPTRTCGPRHLPHIAPRAGGGSDGPCHAPREPIRHPGERGFARALRGVLNNRMRQGIWATWCRKDGKLSPFTYRYALTDSGAPRERLLCWGRRRVFPAHNHARWILTDRTGLESSAVPGRIEKNV